MITRLAILIVILVLVAGCSRPVSQPQAPATPAAGPQAPSTPVAQASAPPQPAATPAPAPAATAPPVAAVSPAPPEPVAPAPTTAPAPPVVPLQPVPPEQPAVPTPPAIPPVGSPGPPQGQPGTQDAVAIIKARLEQFGYRVLEATYKPAAGDQPAILAAVTEASYPQPSGNAVFAQAFAIWSVLAEAVAADSDEALKTMLVAGQMWTKYIIYLALPAGPFKTFQTAAAASPDDEGRMEALKRLQPHLRSAILDTETGQYVDEKDFVNKNFVQ
ncbi:MAG: hypothetical protein ACT4P5_16385 [Armatimonadota bacterium]